ncbi:MAG: ABC transporter permease [Firmicutes bacterium]|nr:ABC transporter permease [Bacillota bacterium]
MNLYQRALASIVRRIPKTLILLIIVLILGNIMLSSLLIVQSVDETKEAMLRELPPIVSLSMDFQKYQELLEDGVMDIPWITFEDLENIERAAGDYIKSYDYSMRSGLQTDSLQRVEQEGGFSFSFGRQTFNCNGTQIPMFTALETGDAEIIEGRTFTEQELEQGSPVVIMSKELAAENDLVVGDTFTLECVISTFGADFQEIVLDTIYYDFQLIGIIQYKSLPAQEESSGGMFGGFDLERERLNNLILPNRFIRDYNTKWMEAIGNYYGGGGGGFQTADYNPLSSVPSFNYVLNSSEQFDQFVRLSETVLNNELYVFTSQEDNFKNVAQPLESMRGILNYVFYITLGSSVVVLALVLFAFARDRKKEIGIYLALGERKARIILQLIMETVAVGLVGAALAVTSSTYLASVISQLMLPAQPVEEAPSFMMMESVLAKIDYASIMQSFNIGLDLPTIIYFFIAIILTIIVAQLIASVYILRFDPKKIMM